MNVFIFRKWVSVVVLESTSALCITYVNMARHHPPTLRDPCQNVYCCGVTELKDDTQHGAQCSCTIPWNPINTMYDLSWIRTLTFKSSIRAYLDYLSLPGTLKWCPGDIVIQLTVCIERKYYSCPCHVYFISLCYTRQNHSVYVIIEFIHAFQLCKFTLFNRIIKPTFPQMYTRPLQALCFYSSLDVNNSNYVRNVLRRVHYTYKFHDF